MKQTTTFTEFEVKRIAVPTDFSDPANIALNHAVDVAKRFGADIFLIHVLEIGAYQGLFAPSDKTEHAQLEKAQEKLQADAHALELRTGINVSQTVVSGRIAEEIVKATKEAGVDLIVMGTHGTSGWEEFFVGSNAYKVVTQSECPVLSIQQKAISSELNSIVLPIDNSPASRQKVKHAAAFAKKFNATIHIAALLTEDDESIRFEFNTKIKQVTDYLERENIPFTTTTLSGDNLATMTMNFAQSKGGNLIVMMTEQEPNLTGFLMGPFAQQIVNHSKIPVLSISPEQLTIQRELFHAQGWY